MLFFPNEGTITTPVLSVSCLLASGNPSPQAGDAGESVETLEDLTLTWNFGPRSDSGTDATATGWEMGQGDRECRRVCVPEKSSEESRR